MLKLMWPDSSSGDLTKEWFNQISFVSAVDVAECMGWQHGTAALCLRLRPRAARRRRSGTSPVIQPPGARLSPDGSVRELAHKNAMRTLERCQNVRFCRDWMRKGIWYGDLNKPGPSANEWRATCRSTALP